MRQQPSITEFLPAKPNRLFTRLMRLVNRFYAMPQARVRCEIHNAERLRGLPPGVLIMPNHSHFDDALVVIELLRQTGRFANFMAARENFNVNHGLNGLVMQWMGGFSVNRGGENGRCQQFAKDVVKHGQYDLLIFPEGEVYLLNDLVMPFKPGVAMLALDVASENRSERRAERPVTIVPIAVKYRYVDDVMPALGELAAELETAYFGERRTGPLYDRIYAIGLELLRRTEEKWGLHPEPAWDVYDRVQHIRTFLLDSLERRYFGKVRDELPFDRAQRLMLHLLETVEAVRVQPDLSDAERKARTADLRRDLQRAEAAARSVSFAEDYLINRPTPERMAETLTKLAREIRGRYAELPNVSRSAVITIGEPIDVRRYLPDYDARGSRKDTIVRLVRDLQASVQSMIDAANAAIENGAPGRRGRGRGGPPVSALAGSRPLGWLSRLIERLTRHRVAEQATVIAFNIIYAMFPLAICLTAIGGYLYRTEAARAGLLHAVNAAFPAQVAKEMSDVINTAGRHSGLFGVVGFLALFWAGSNLFATIENGFARIFGTPARGVVRQRLVAFLMIIVFSALLLLAVAASNLALLAGGSPAAPTGRALGLFGGWAFAVLTPLALYVVVPNVWLPARALWASAMFAGTALEMVTLVFPLYIRYLAGVNRFGDAFGLTFLLMTWSYLVAFILLLGAEIGALLAPRPRPYPQN